MKRFKIAVSEMNISERCVSCCGSIKTPTTPPAIAHAKFSDFDAGCVIDLQFLECGDLEAVRKTLSAADTAETKNALNFLEGWEKSDERESVDAKINWERAYYGV